VTAAEHPYVSKFWPPGHLIGYEHTFIAALGDFLSALESGQAYHPDFDDALKVQQILETVTISSKQRSWIKVPGALAPE
jgi:predicted dehydrogenase